MCYGLRLERHDFSNTRGPRFAGDPTFAPRALSFSRPLRRCLLNLLLPFNSFMLWAHTLQPLRLEAIAIRTVDD